MDVRPSLGQAKIPLHNKIVKKMVVLGTRITDPPKIMGLWQRSPSGILELKAMLLEVHKAPRHVLGFRKILGGESNTHLSAPACQPQAPQNRKTLRRS